MNNKAILMAGKFSHHFLGWIACFQTGIGIGITEMGFPCLLNILCDSEHGEHGVLLIFQWSERCFHWPLAYYGNMRFRFPPGQDEINGMFSIQDVGNGLTSMTLDISLNNERHPGSFKQSSFPNLRDIFFELWAQGRNKFCHLFSPYWDIDLPQTSHRLIRTSTD